VSLGSRNIVHTALTFRDTDLLDVCPIRTSPAGQKVIDNEVAKMLAVGVIRPSQSPWAAPVVVVSKKDGNPRFCIDYRKLNAVTKRDSYPLPRIDKALDQLSKAKYLSTLDQHLVTGKFLWLKKTKRRLLLLLVLVFMSGTCFRWV
jgi:hypothetical protein